MHGVQTELTVVQQQQATRLLTQDLPTQLTTDAARRTGHQNGLVAKSARQYLGLRFHRLSSEQVIDVELKKILYRHATAGQVGQPRNGSGVDWKGLQALDDLVAPIAGSTWHGQQNIADLEPFHHGGNLGWRKHRYAVDRLTDF